MARSGIHPSRRRAAASAMLVAALMGGPAWAQQTQQGNQSVMSATSMRVPDLPPLGKPEEAGMSSERLAEIGKTLNADIAAGRIPGAVIAIARKGRLVYFEAFGFRDKAASVPMTTDTIFSIASMTKPMVALAGLQLYEQGKLLIDDPLSLYFPKFADMKVAVMDDQGTAISGTVPAKRKITIQDLMRHTSGLIYGGRGATAVHKLYPSGSTPAGATMSGQAFLDKLAGLPLLHQPGAVWDYGFGLDVLGLVIEKLAEQPLGDYLRGHVWAPLGMNDTYFQIPPEQAARYAKPLPVDPVTGEPQTIRPATDPLQFQCGGGCAASTASDYLRFALMLKNKGRLGDTRIIARKTADFMLSNQLGPEVKNLIVNADPTRADYGFGLGLAVRTQTGVVRMMGSPGEFTWPGATGTNWWVDPQEDLAVVFMAQSPGAIRWHYRQLIAALVYAAVTD